MVNIRYNNFRDEYDFIFDKCEILLESKNVFKVLIKDTYEFRRETIWEKENLNSIVSTFSDHRNDYYACVYANPSEFKEIKDELMKQVIECNLEYENEEEG